MIPPALLPAGSILVGLASFGASLLTRRRARVLAASAVESVNKRWEEFQAIAGELRNTLDGQATQLAELRQQAQLIAAPPAPRASLNLGKRSQVLRLHRKGDPPDRIAAELDIPLQEVDLLIKVHRIVLGRL